MSKQGNEDDGKGQDKGGNGRVEEEMEEEEEEETEPPSATPPTLETETTGASSGTGSSESTHRVMGPVRRTTLLRSGTMPDSESISSSDETGRRVLLLWDVSYGAGKQGAGAGEWNEGKRGGSGEEDREVDMSEGSGYGSLFALSVISGGSDEEEADEGSAFSSSGWVEVNER